MASQLLQSSQLSQLSQLIPCPEGCSHISCIKMADGSFKQFPVEMKSVGLPNVGVATLGTPNVGTPRISSVQRHYMYQFHCADCNQFGHNKGTTQCALNKPLRVPSMTIPSIATPRGYIYQFHCTDCDRYGHNKGSRSCPKMEAYYKHRVDEDIVNKGF